VIASAVIPTLIAGMTFLPRHLLATPEKLTEQKAEQIEEG